MKLTELELLDKLKLYDENKWYSDGLKLIDENEEAIEKKYYHIMMYKISFLLLLIQPIIRLYFFQCFKYYTIIFC